MIKSMLIAGAGGFVGTALRYLAGVWVKSLFHGSFPLGTFFVNVSGCFVMGLLFGLAEKSQWLGGNHLLLLATGFCGGFTTFSAFSNEVWQLGAKGDWLTGALYLLASVVAGLLCVWAGRCVVA